MAKMEIFLDGDGYMVKSDDRETLEIFGTDTLPLPFLKEYPVDSIKRVLEQMNPGATVTIREVC